MWICPKCKREFKRKNQGHYCGKAPETIDEYILSQSIDVQPYLIEMRKIIHQSIPEAKECIVWSMPTYYKDTNILHFVSNKNHIALHVGTEVIEELKSRLHDYKTNKSTIYFPYNLPLPSRLISDIVKWCYEHRK